MISEKLMDVLACPDCMGDVKQVSETIVCIKCGRIYPIREDIPVMLIEESWKEGELPPAKK